MAVGVREQLTGNRGKESRDPPPPSSGEGGSGGGNGWCLLTTADNQIQAHLLRGILEEHGIECLLDGFNAAPGAWMMPFGDPLAPVRLLVRRLDRHSASLLLHEVGHEPASVADEGRSGYSRTEMLVALSIGLLAALLTFLKISGGGPCLLAVYCL